LLIFEIPGLYVVKRLKDGFAKVAEIQESNWPTLSNYGQCLKMIDRAGQLEEASVERPPV